MCSFSSMSNSLSHSAGEDDPADEGARQRRVEHVGVFGQADAQGLRRSGEGQQREQQRRAEETKTS